MAENVAKLRALRRTSGSLLPQIYHHAHALPAGGQYERVLGFIKAHPDLAAKLVKKFGVEHPRGVNLEKVDKAGLEAARDAAEDIVAELAPLYGLLEEIAIFQEHTLRVLTDLSQSLLPFSLEYTPELLDSYMGLFTEACKIHILAAKMPRPLILQMYALAFDFRHSSDPPHFKEISLFVLHYQEVFPRLQAEFQPVSIRVGEILEKIVAPALRCASDFRQLRGSDLFSLVLSGQEDAAEPKGLAGMTATQTYTLIKRLDTLREWAVFGILACPGESVRSEVRGLVSAVLKDSFKQTVYRNHSEWIHLLFEKHVVPSMASAVKKSAFGFSGKKDLKKIVERAFGEACDCAMAEHHTRRTWLLQQLEALNAFLQEEPEVLAYRREMVAALLSLSRSEVQWIMQHGGDVLPRGLPMSWVRPGLHSAAQPLKVGFPDVGLVVLLAAHCNLVAAAQRYRTALQCHAAWEMWDQLSGTVQPMFEQVASAPTLTKQHQPVIQTIEQLLCKYSEVCEVLLRAWSSSDSPSPDREEGGQQKSGGGEPKQGQVEHTITSLPAVREIWFSLNAQLFSVRTNVTGQSLDALIAGHGGSSSAAAAPRNADLESAEVSALGLGLGSANHGNSIVKELNRLSDLSQVVADIDASLQDAASLQALCFQVPRLQTLFMAAMHSIPDISRHCTAFLPVVSSFHHNDCPKFNEDHGKVAEDLAEQLMTAMTAHLRTLLYDLCKLSFSSPNKEPSSATQLHHQAPATSSSMSRDGIGEAASAGGSTGNANGGGGSDVLSSSTSSASPSLGVSRNISVSLSAVMKGSKTFMSSVSATDGLAGGLLLPSPLGSSMEALWHCEAARACMASVTALIQACTPSPISGRYILVSRRKAFAAEEWLREGIASTLRTVVRQAAWSGKNLHRPTQLEKKVECFCSMLSVIQDYTAIDLGMLVREVLIGQTFIPLPGAAHLAEGTSPDRGRFSPAGPRRQIGSVSSNKSVSQIADWLLSHIVRDRADAGVAYSVQKLTFFSRASSNFQQQLKAAVGPSVDASLYASLSEIRALVRLYGPYFAVELGTKLEPSLQEWVLSLNVILKVNESLLTKLSQTLKEPHRVEAAHQAADLKAAQQVFRQLGRTLFMRQLASIACDMELDASVPYMGAAVDYARAQAAWRDVCFEGTGGSGTATQQPGSKGVSLPALLGLPPPAVCSGPDSPGSDPVLKFFFTEIDSKVFRRWRQLPLLAGLLVAGGDWSHATWLPQWEALSHDCHCLPHVVHCVAVAMEEAALQRGDIEPVTAEALLSAFSGCAAKVALSQGAPHPAQMMMLESMACSHHRHHHLSTAASVPGCLPAACFRSTYSSLRAHSQA